MSGTYALIIAGGAGTRFWPASRVRKPKQFLALAGRDESLLAATARRIAPLCGLDNLLVATGEHLREQTRNVLPTLRDANLLCEPVARNTAPCIGWAARVIAQRDPDALMMVLPSDHAIADEQGFVTAAREALRLAADGYFATIGIEPNRPETGYGYIEIGAPLGPTSYRVERFVEKPIRERAEAFLRGGRHAWNGGMFFFRASLMNEAIRRFVPALAEGLDTIEKMPDVETLRRVFPTLPSISIDHGIMEHATPLAVVRGAFGWSDVGSWESAWELAAKDANGNAVPTSTVSVDANRNYVCDLRADSKGGRVVALLGVNDLVVVATDDALVILPRDRAQDIRAVVEELKKRDDSLL